MSDRASPHSLEAEKAVLGAILASPGLWHEATASVRADEFYRHAHRLLFRSMTRLVAAGIGIDYLSLVEDLRRAGDLDEVGGPAYVSGLADGVPRAANVAHYAGIVREKARLRRLVEAGEWLADEASRGSTLAARLADGAAGRLSTLLSDDRKGLCTAEEAIGAYVARLAAGEAEGMATGYADLDRLVGGVRRGDLVVVGARPGVGKTSFGLGLAEHLAAQGRRALVFSMEMTAQALAARLLSWRSQVSVSRLERGQATDDEYRRVMEVSVREAPGQPLKINDSARTVSEVAAWCRRLREEDGLDCVVLDYLQLVVAEEKYHSREAEVASVSHGLLRVAKDMDVPVVALSQLSRAPEDRRDKRPTMADIRESGAVEQDAALLLLLFREEQYKRTDENAGVAECIVAKNRQGPTGTTRLAFAAELAQFRNLANF